MTGWYQRLIYSLPTKVISIWAEYQSAKWWVQPFSFYKIEKKKFIWFCYNSQFKLKKGINRPLFDLTRIYYLLHTGKSVAERQRQRPNDTSEMKYVVVLIQSHVFFSHFIPHWTQHTFLQSSKCFDGMDYKIYWSNRNENHLAEHWACWQKVWLDSLTFVQ